MLTTQVLTSARAAGGEMLSVFTGLRHVDFTGLSSLAAQTTSPGWGKKDTSNHRQPSSTSIGEYHPLEAHPSSPCDVCCGVGPGYLQETTSSAVARALVKLKV